jgi:hypothetical protein
MLMAYSSPPSPNEAGENAVASPMTPAISRVGSDGAFSLKGLRPGKVTLQAFIMTAGPLKITRIERGGVEMTEGIVVTGREGITGVRVVIEMSKKNREEK